MRHHERGEFISLALATPTKTDTISSMDTGIELMADAERLLALARALDRDNVVLRGRLAQAEAHAASLEKRLAAARSRIEALIERLPSNGSLLDGQ